MKLRNLIICSLIMICSLALGNWSSSSADAKEYDGVWFLGFNLHVKLFGNENGKFVRQAIATAIDREKIAKKIIGDELVPIGVIPPGMEGYDTSLAPYPHDYGIAKKLMIKAGHPLNDKHLKHITLLMTDGEKTKLIVDEIKRDLINIGFDISTTAMKYSNTKEWIKELMEFVNIVVKISVKKDYWQDRWLAPVLNVRQNCRKHFNYE